MAKKISMTEAVRRFAEGMASAINQSSIVTQCVSACAAHFQGDTPDAKSIKEFADGVAEIRGWSESSARARKSEVRNIVRNYVRLPAAIKAVTDSPKCEGFTWHNAIKVARLCKDHKSDAALVKAYFETKPSKHVTPLQKIKKSLTTVLETTTTSKDWLAVQDEISKLLAKRNLSLD